MQKKSIFVAVFATQASLKPAYIAECLAVNPQQANGSAILIGAEKVSRFESKTSPDSEIIRDWVKTGDDYIATDKHYKTAKGRNIQVQIFMVIPHELMTNEESRPTKLWDEDINIVSLFYEQTDD